MWKITSYIISLILLKSSLYFSSVSCLNLTQSTLVNSSSDFTAIGSALNHFISIFSSAAAVVDPSKYILSDVQSMNTSQLIKYYGGYTTEEHTVNSNGYILRLFRIKNSGPCSVFIMHGLFTSSDDWLGLGNNSLPLYLAKQGYDVWLGNARGNTYSRKHVTLSPSSPEFWDFSWHEIGTEDLAYSIDYILKTTGGKNLTYVGHSQGTTSVYVLLSEKPTYNKKLNGVVSLSSVSYMGNVKSPVLQLLAKFIAEIRAAFQALKIYELFPHRPPTSLITAICASSKILSTLLLTVLFTGFGFDYDQIDYNLTDTQLAHYPGGSSLRQVLHYLQNTNSKKFQMYDFGESQNLITYGSSVAPDYSIGNITANMCILYGDNDWLSNYEKDVSLFIDGLPTKPDVFRVDNDKCNHMDYQWGKDSKTLMYETVNNCVTKFNS